MEVNTPSTTNDCSEWQTFSGSRFAIGVDAGFKVDHSAVCLAGEFSTPTGQVIAIQKIVQFPLQTPVSNVIGVAVDMFNTIHSHGKPCVIAADSRNNLPFVTALGQSGVPAEYVVATNLTSSERHTPRPQRLTLAPKLAVMEFLLSRTQMFSELATAFQEAEIRVCPQGAQQLLGELSALRYEAGANGHVRVTCPSGGHDDLAVVAGYACWALKHLPVKVGAIRPRGQMERPLSAVAWT